MVQRTTPPFRTSMSALLGNRWASEGIKLVFLRSPLWFASKSCFVCRQRCLDTYTEHQHCALAHSPHNPRRNQQGYWNFYRYRPSHRLWLHCQSRVVCVVRARCESRTYKIPPHVWAQREGRTHGCWQLSCQQDPTREPRLCARRSDDQRVLVGTVAWPPWVATSLILDRSKLRWIETPCRSCTQARFFERTRRLVARVSGTEG